MQFLLSPPSARGRTTLSRLQTPGAGGERYAGAELRMSNKFGIFDSMSQIVKKPASRRLPAGRSKEKMILEAARRRFGHYGFSKVTMDEVAADVGVVKGSLYYYFPTKESLFEAVIREEQRQFALEIRGMPAKGRTCGEIINLYVAKRQQFFRKLVNLSQLDLLSWMKIKAGSVGLFRKFEQMEVAFLEQVFRDGIRSGEVLVEDPRHAAILFLHVLQGLRLRALKDLYHGPVDGRAHAGVDHEIESFTQVYLDGITRR